MVFSRSVADRPSPNALWQIKAPHGLDFSPVRQHRGYCLQHLASGGYLMACVADDILAAPFAVCGSIGSRPRAKPTAATTALSTATSGKIP